MHGGPRVSQSPSAGGDLFPALAVPLEEIFPSAAPALLYSKPVAKPGITTVDVHSALRF